MNNLIYFTYTNQYYINLEVAILNNFFVNLVTIEIILFSIPIFLYITSFFIKSNKISRCFVKLSKKSFSYNSQLHKYIFKFLIKLIMNILNISTSGTTKLSKAELIYKINNMSPRDFEVFCYKLYKNLGYSSFLMPDGPDGGKDVILTDSSNTKYYVECKRYLKDVVGREICQKLIGSCAMDNVQHAIIFTCGKIHTNAYEYQKSLNSKNNFNLQLIDMDKIFDMYNSSDLSCSCIEDLQDINLETYLN